jgi:hypothetical protein
MQCSSPGRKVAWYLLDEGGVEHLAVEGETIKHPGQPAHWHFRQCKLLDLLRFVGKVLPTYVRLVFSVHPVCFMRCFQHACRSPTKLWMICIIGTLEQVSHRSSSSEMASTIPVSRPIQNHTKDALRQREAISCSRRGHRRASTGVQWSERCACCVCPSSVCVCKERKPDRAFCSKQVGRFSFFPMWKR